MVVLAGACGLAGGMARLGMCVHNRRHALQMAKAKPGARVASLVWRLKPPRGEEDRYYQARLKVRKVREPVPSEARSSRCGGLGVGSKRLACARCKKSCSLMACGAFNKTGRTGARSRGGDRTRFGPENCDAAGETRGPTRVVAQHRAVSGTLGRHFEQLCEFGGPHVGARVVWPNCLGRPQRPRAKTRH
ncbi:hypothetical protein ERJ75_001498100 [Trypanosoma vivax]|nr:hypothetical protein ERJ75_001498100 [Trypanosoma vivax]